MWFPLSSSVYIICQEIKQVRVIHQSTAHNACMNLIFTHFTCCYQYNIYTASNKRLTQPSACQMQYFKKRRHGFSPCQNTNDAILNFDCDDVINRAQCVSAIMGLFKKIKVQIILRLRLTLTKPVCTIYFKKLCFLWNCNIGTQKMMTWPAVATSACGDRKLVYFSVIPYFTVFIKYLAVNDIVLKWKSRRWCLSMLLCLF